jgi:hypothetical protein
MNGMDLNGQTAPESTHGLFGAPQELKVKLPAKFDVFIKLLLFVKYR